MYAVVVTVTIDSARVDEAQAFLQSTIVPRVQGSPGAQHGTWLRPDDGTKGMSLIVFDTRENAEAAAEMIPDEPGPGVKVQSKEIREVAAGF